MDSPINRDWRATDALVVLFLAGAAWVAIPSFLPRDLPVTTAPALTALAFLFAAAAGARLRDRPLEASLAPGRLDPGLVFWTIVGTVGLSLLLMNLAEPLLDLFRLLGRDYRPDLGRLEEDIRGIPPAAAWLLLAGLAPLGEEAVFRGALLRGFRSSWGTPLALVGSSLLFASFHVLPPRIVVTFVLGLWLGAVAIRSGGLAAPLLAHAANNALVLALMASGAESVPPAAAAAGSVAAGLAAWRLFGSRDRSVQGSAPLGPS